MESFTSEKVRLAYVAAQTASIDIKIDCAIIETMKIYRKVLGSSTGLACLPTAPATNRAAAAIAVCNAIIKCFGVPTVSGKTAYEITKCNLWDDMGDSLAILFAEGLATVGTLGMVASGGAPFFLASAPINIALVVPATTRLMLLLASDLILIFTRAFKDITFTCVGQPHVKDFQRAAIQYRDLSRKVHKEVLALVPKHNIVRSFRHHQVRRELKKILHRYKVQVMENTAAENVGEISVRTNDPHLSKDEEVKTEIQDIQKDVLPSYAAGVDVAHFKDISTVVSEVEDFPIEKWR